MEESRLGCTDLTLRLATSADCPGLLPIQRELHSLHVAAVPRFYRNSTDEELIEAMKEFLGQPDTKVWAALEDTELLGYAILKIVEQPATIFSYARKVGILDQLAVLQRAQRRGIGRALLREATRSAEQEGCSSLRLDVIEFNDAARQFYVANGFATSRQHMTIDLSSDEARLGQ